MIKCFCGIFISRKFKIYSEDNYHVFFRKNIKSYREKILTSITVLPLCHILLLFPHRSTHAGMCMYFGCCFHALNLIGNMCLCERPFV